MYRFFFFKFVSPF